MTKNISKFSVCYERTILYFSIFVTSYKPKELNNSLHDKDLNLEFFLVSTFLYLNWIQEQMDKESSEFGHFYGVTHSKIFFEDLWIVPVDKTQSWKKIINGMRKNKGQDQINLT